jgi:hypothetical protein
MGNIAPVLLRLGSAHLTHYGRAIFGVDTPPDGILDSAKALMGLQNMASFSNYAEKKVLNHALGKGAWTMPTTIALALCTVVPTDTSTGATLTEANYTGYARKVIAAAALSEAVEGAPSEIKNAEALTFPECTAGSSTVVGYAVLDSSTLGAGNIITWGTVTSTAITTTQTPATIPANGLVVTLD